MMEKKFETFADKADEAKPVSDFDFNAYREKMKKIMRDAKRHNAQALRALVEAKLTR